MPFFAKPKEKKAVRNIEQATEIKTDIFTNQAQTVSKISIKEGASKEFCSKKNILEEKQ